MLDRLLETTGTEKFQKIERLVGSVVERLRELERLNMKLSTDLAEACDEEPKPAKSSIRQPWSMGSSPESLYYYLQARLAGLGVNDALVKADIPPIERQLVVEKLNHHLNKAREFEPLVREEYLAELLREWQLRRALGGVS